MSKLFYLMHHPQIELWDAWWETDVKCVSLNENTVRFVYEYEMSLEDEEGQEDYRKENWIGSFDTDMDITSNTVWVIFSYSHTNAESAEFLYAGSCLEDCLNWCRRNRNISDINCFEHQTNEFMLDQIAQCYYKTDAYIWTNNSQYRISDGIWIKELKLN